MQAPRKCKGVIVLYKDLWFMAFIQHPHDLFVHKYSKTNSIWNTVVVNYRIKSIHTQNATIEFSEIHHSFVHSWNIFDGPCSFSAMCSHSLQVNTHPLRFVATMHWMWRYLLHSEYRTKCPISNNLNSDNACAHIFLGVRIKAASALFKALATRTMYTEIEHREKH